MTDVNEKIEIVKQALIDGWSIQVSFRKARIKPKTDEYYFVYKQLINLIEAYKIRKIDDKRHPLHR